MPTLEEIQAQQELLAAHRRTLTVYLKQQALHSEAFTPPAVEHGIREGRRQIQAIKAQLRQSGVTVADHADDEAPLDALSGGGGSPFARLILIIGTLIIMVGFAIVGYVIISFIMTIFTNITTNPSEPPDFSSLPLDILPIGIGLFFGGGVIVTLVNLISGGGRTLSRR